MTVCGKYISIRNEDLQEYNRILIHNVPGKIKDLDIFGDRAVVTVEVLNTHVIYDLDMNKYPMVWKKVHNFRGKNTDINPIPGGLLLFELYSNLDKYRLIALNLPAEKKAVHEFDKTIHDFAVHFCAQNKKIIVACAEDANNGVNVRIFHVSDRDGTDMIIQNTGAHFHIDGKIECFRIIGFNDTHVICHFLRKDKEEKQVVTMHRTDNWKQAVAVEMKATENTDEPPDFVACGKMSAFLCKNVDILHVYTDSPDGSKESNAMKMHSISALFQLFANVLYGFTISPLIKLVNFPADTIIKMYQPTDSPQNTQKASVQRAKVLPPIDSLMITVDSTASTPVVTVTSLFVQDKYKDLSFEYCHLSGNFIHIMRTVDDVLYLHKIDPSRGQKQSEGNNYIKKSLRIPAAVQVKQDTKVVPTIVKGMQDPDHNALSDFEYDPNNEDNTEVNPKSATTKDASVKAKPQENAATKDGFVKAKPQENAATKDGFVKAKPQENAATKDGFVKAKPQENAATIDVSVKPKLHEDAATTDGSVKAKPQENAATKDVSVKAKLHENDATPVGSDHDNPQNNATPSQSSPVNIIDSSNNPTTAVIHPPSSLTGDTPLEAIVIRPMPLLDSDSSTNLTDTARTSNVQAIPPSTSWKTVLLSGLISIMILLLLTFEVYRMKTAQSNVDFDV